MEQQFKTDSEIYAVLEREIIDLTLRPGCSLSENPLCTRFGAPRSLIRVVLQRLQENGLVKIVPYKGTTVTRLNRDIVDELIYERIAVEARVLRDFAPHCTPEHRALIRQRAAAYDELAKAETLDFNRLYEADTRLHETWFSAMGKMYLWRTLQNAHADYSRFRMLDTLTTGGLAEVVADHHNLIDAIERCDLAAFEPLVERSTAVSAVWAVSSPRNTQIILNRRPKNKCSMWNSGSFPNHLPQKKRQAVPFGKACLVFIVGSNPCRKSCRADVRCKITDEWIRRLHPRRGHDQEYGSQQKHKCYPQFFL